MFVHQAAVPPNYLPTQLPAALHCRWMLLHIESNDATELIYIGSATILRVQFVLQNRIFPPMLELPHVRNVLRTTFFQH